MSATILPFASGSRWQLARQFGAHELGGTTAALGMGVQLVKENLSDAWQVTEYGRPTEALELVEIPEPSPGQARSSCGQRRAC